MTVVKRAFRELESAVDVCSIDQDPQHCAAEAGGYSSKRACRMPELCRPADPSQRASIFLDALSDEAGGHAAMLGFSPGLADPAVWRCWAEAHMLLEAA